MFRHVRTYRRNGRTDARRSFLYVCTQHFTCCSLFYGNDQRSELTCFRALKINGNENSKVFDRRTKSFHQIVLLQTMHPVYRTMVVFAVPDQITRNSKVGYIPIRTEYRTHENKTILELSDFSLFGVSAPLWGVAIVPNHKSKIWRIFQYECTQ